MTDVPSKRCLAVQLQANLALNDKIPAILLGAYSHPGKGHFLHYQVVLVCKTEELVVAKSVLIFYLQTIIQITQIFYSSMLKRYNTKVKQCYYNLRINKNYNTCRAILMIDCITKR